MFVDWLVGAYYIGRQLGTQAHVSLRGRQVGVWVGGNRVSRKICPYFLVHPLCLSHHPSKPSLFRVPPSIWPLCPSRPPLLFPRLFPHSYFPSLAPTFWFLLSWYPSPLFFPPLPSAADFTDADLRGADFSLASAVKVPPPVVTTQSHAKNQSAVPCACHTTTTTV